MNTFTVIFRTGGHENCEWHRTLAFPTKEEALGAKKEIERGGRKALLFKTHELDIIGLPEGWEA